MGTMVCTLDRKTGKHIADSFMPSSMTESQAPSDPRKTCKLHSQNAEATMGRNAVGSLPQGF